MKTLTTEQLFRKVSGFRQTKGRPPQMIMPTSEVYFPKGNQGVARMGFQWRLGQIIEFADYSALTPAHAAGCFWGGIPMSTL